MRFLVVGGGIAGASVAYHLAGRGEKVLLLEQNVVGGGTTHHAAGMVARTRSSQALTRMTVASARLYAGLEAETGVATGWIGCGSLLLARTPDRLTALRRHAALGRLWGIEAEELAPAEAARHWPGIHTDDLAGAIWVPGDGKVDPLATARSLAAGASARGAHLAEGVRVARLLREGDRVRGAETADGSRIEAETVVLTAGMWTRQLAAAIGVPLALHAVEHHYVHLAPVEGVHDGLPCMRDYDAALYFRPDRDGLWLGAFQLRSTPWRRWPIPDDFSMRLLEPDWPAFEVPMREGAHRLPALAGAPVERFVNGPESFTPDGQYLLGPLPGLDGIFVLAAYNSFGIAQSGGAGEVVAEWLIDGDPPMDLWGLDPSRFQPLQAGAEYLRERVAETLGVHYAVPWPNRQLETARGLRRTPLHDRLAARGAVFGLRAAWERPLFYARDGRPARLEYGWQRQAWFADWAVEHRATREAVAIYDQTSFGKLELRGPDALAALQWLCTADVDVAPGRAIYTAMLDERGRFVSDLTVLRLGADEFRLIVAAATQLHDADWIRRGLRAAGVHAQLTDVTSGGAVVGLHGPRSRELLAGLTELDLSTEALPYLAFSPAVVGGAAALVLRVSYVGELGYELHVPSEQAAHLLERVLEAAGLGDTPGPGGPLGAVLAGTVAQDSLRLEKSFGAWGHDLSLDDTPLEAGMAFLCAWAKEPGFRGCEALLAQRERGIRRRLVTLVLQDPEPLLWGGEVILRDGEPVGELTSGSFGHTVGAGIGMGYVHRHDGATIDRDWLAGGSYGVDVAGRTVPATLHLRAPHDPERRRMIG
ncbi:MAG TPA: FAD-dependent oxidoreductase [Candidatus Limnocylindrales bacterium]|nr:FAD-dependent oxidoreductase [Candidatus Limnocylindrales bacterium]